MKKNILQISLVALLLILTVTVGKFVIHSSNNKPSQGDTAKWSQYMSAKQGFSFDYPSNEITPTTEDSFGSTTVRIDDRTLSSTKISDMKMVVVTLVPTNSNEINSVDDWINKVKNSPAPGVALANLRYKNISGEKMAVYNNTTENSSDTQALFFHGGKLYSVTILNLSQITTEHILESFVFTNK